MWHLSREEGVLLPGEAGSLEGLLCELPGERGAVVTHPHPLYGGNMYNPVVEALSRACGAAGCSTLRFNFRGTGGSGGTFGGGAAEAEDVLAAVDFLTGRGIGEIHLLGYSFGARVLANIERLPDAVRSQIHVAPPVAFMDYRGVAGIERLTLVLAGEDDEIGPPETIRDQLRKWNSEAGLEVLPGADHFFFSSLNRLEEAVREQLSRSVS